MKLMMNIWSKKQFLSKYDEAYMRAGNELLKTPALGLQGVPPWTVDNKRHKFCTTSPCAP